MTNTRYPWRPGWRSGRGLGGRNSTRISYDDTVAATSDGSAERLSSTGGSRLRFKEQLDDFRRTFECTSDEEEFSGFTDLALGDVLDRYRALIKSSEVLANDRPRPAFHSHISHPSASASASSLSTVCPFRTSESTFVANQTDATKSSRPTVALVRPVSKSIDRRIPTNHPLMGALGLISSHDGAVRGAQRTAEQTSGDDTNMVNCDWNHNRTEPECNVKAKSTKIGSRWACKRKGFERKFFRKRESSGPERTAEARMLDEEEYLSQEHLNSGRISPDSGNDSAQSNSCSPSDGSLFWKSSPLTFQLPSVTSSLPLTSAASVEQNASQTKTHQRKRRCRRCPGCLAVDCGSCYACRDMIKYGGRGISKQACCQRRCRQPIHPYDQHAPREKLSNMKSSLPSANSSFRQSLPKPVVAKSVSMGVSERNVSNPAEVVEEAPSPSEKGMEVQENSEPVSEHNQSPLLQKKRCNSILRPSALSSVPSLSLTQQLQKRVVPPSEAVDRDVIWASVVKMVDDCLMEQMRQKRDIDKNLEDNLYSSIRDMVKTLLPPMSDGAKLLSSVKTSDEAANSCARALPFMSRKSRDMFSFLLSQHRPQITDALTQAKTQAKTPDEMNFDLTQR